MSITEHLAKLEAIAGKATPVPFNIAGGNDTDDYPLVNGRRMFHVYSLHNGADVALCWTMEDAAFIARARTELPKLRAALKLTMEYLESLRGSEAQGIVREVAAILGAQQETKP